MKIKKIVSSVLVLSSLFLFGCANNDNNSSNQSIVSSIVSEEEAINVAKALVDANKNNNSSSIRINNFNFVANAKYKQTKHLEEYALEIKDSTLDLEVDNIQDYANIKAYLDVIGGYKTLCQISNNGVIDEDESSKVEVSLNHDTLYFEDSKIYASLSKELVNQISEDSSDSGIKFFVDNINNIFSKIYEKKDDVSGVINPTQYANPVQLLDTLCNSALIKSYVKYNKVNSDYIVNFKLKKSDLVSLINNVSSSYSSKTSINDDAKVDLSITYNSNEFKSIVIDSNILASLNFDSLGKVDFNYVFNGNMTYSPAVLNINNIDKTSYSKFDDITLDVGKFVSDSFDNIKNIYNQVVAFIKN